MLLVPSKRNVLNPRSLSLDNLPELLREVTQEAKYVERWPSTTFVWAGWSRFYIPVDRYGGVHSLLPWPSRGRSNSRQQ
jgi:hypothetical protein